MHDLALCWFRRDLRDHDHAALAAALEAARRVACVFVFDREILDSLDHADDRRVSFIHTSVLELHHALQERGGGLFVQHGMARNAVPALAQSLGASAVFWNADEEPAARHRDAAVEAALREAGIHVGVRKDRVIFDATELRTGTGKPYTVFGAYRRAWLKRFATQTPSILPLQFRNNALLRPPAPPPALAELGFRAVDLDSLGIPGGMRAAQARWQRFQSRLADYARDRDRPAVDAGSGLSVDLRFGTLSVRSLALAASDAARHGNAGAAAWLDELIWREFFAQILATHPQVVDTAFQKRYASLQFANDSARFEAWCQGRTGYPFVDAGMRELLQTGRMHNRLRMVTASFLVKHLLVDWRWGERHFARELLDFDLASNNGNWQWVASTGCDAQPWFRIFNPVTQSRRFDPAGTYIRRYVPELAALDARTLHAPWEAAPEILAAKGITLGRDYPKPLVDHAEARAAALALYREASEDRQN